MHYKFGKSIFSQNFKSIPRQLRRSDTIHDRGCSPWYAAKPNELSPERVKLILFL